MHFFAAIIVGLIAAFLVIGGAWLVALGEAGNT